MKSSLESAAGRNLFTAYGDGYVDVNGTRYSENMVVIAEAVTRGWLAGKAYDGAMASGCAGVAKNRGCDLPCRLGCRGGGSEGAACGRPMAPIAAFAISFRFEPLEMAVETIT